MNLGGRLVFGAFANAVIIYALNQYDEGLATKYTIFILFVSLLVFRRQLFGTFNQVRRMIG